MSNKRHIRIPSLTITPLATFFMSIICILFSTTLSNAEAAYKPQVQTLGATSISRHTTVSAFVGDAIFTVFGYTHPYARVVIEGQGIFHSTTADESGKFTLTNRFIPGSQHEGCITAYDNNGGSSQPLCLPPFPNKKRVTIGPIILPPIIAVNQHEFAVQDYGILSGKTVPNAVVNLNAYASEISNNTTNGDALPEIELSSDDAGEFSITLPTEQEQKIRMFATTDMNGLNSQKSNTLAVDILPIWKILLQKLSLIFDFINQHLIPLILGLEIGILTLWLWWYFRRKKQAHPLALRPDHSLFKADSL